MNKRKAYQIGLAFGLQFRQNVATTVRTTEDALAKVLSDSPYSVHFETLQWEVMALLDFAYIYGMASAAGTAPGDSRDHSSHGFYAGFRTTAAELKYNFGRAQEYATALKQEKDRQEYVAGRLETEIGGRQIAAVGAVFARNIGFEGNASVIAIAANIYQDAYGRCFVLLRMKNKKVFRQKRKKAEAYQVGLASGLMFREYVLTKTRMTMDFLQSHVDVLAVDSGTLHNEVMALLNFAFSYGMASGANDSIASGFLHEGFLESFHPSKAESAIVCEDRIREYVAALNQEKDRVKEYGAARLSKAEISGRQIAAVGAVFAKHIGYEGNAIIVAHAASMYNNTFNLAFDQTSP